MKGFVNKNAALGEYVGMCFEVQHEHADQDIWKRHVCGWSVGCSCEEAGGWRGVADDKTVHVLLTKIFRRLQLWVARLNSRQSDLQDAWFVTHASIFCRHGVEITKGALGTIWSYVSSYVDLVDIPPCGLWRAAGWTAGSPLLRDSPVALASIPVDRFFNAQLSECPFQA